jgi:lysophospholipase L1-like esterase
VRRVFAPFLLVIVCVALSACVPIPAPPPSDPRLFVVGDSVSLGAQAAIRDRLSRAGWWVKQISVESLHTYEAVGIVDANRRWIGDVVVVQLGTNDGGDPQFPAWIDQVMTQLKDVPRVYWINLRSFRGFVPAANSMINAATKRWKNMRVIDWRAYADARPWIVYGDGYHLNPTGQDRMARLIEDAVGNFVLEQRAKDRRSAPPTLARPHLPRSRG